MSYPLNFSQTEPLASSTQTYQLDSREQSIPVMSSNSKEPYTTQEWNLASFSRFVESKQEPGREQSQNSEHGQPQMDRPNGWENWTDQIGFRLVVRLAGFGHLCIMHGLDVLESYFLVLSKRWMKAVLVGPEVMIMAKHNAKINRLRLTFESNDKSHEFFEQLSEFVSVNPDQHKQLGEPEFESNRVEEPVERLMKQTEAGFVPPVWSTEWPTQSLEGLVQLCLKDPNFPGFVGRVDQIMKKLTVGLSETRMNMD